MKHAYINGMILDGSKEMEPQRGKVILTDGENIEAIVERVQIKDKDLAEYEITDLAGNYIMPGLINLAPASAGDRKTEEKTAGSCEAGQASDEQRSASQSGDAGVRRQREDTAFERGHDDPNRRRGAGL